MGRTGEVLILEQEFIADLDIKHEVKLAAG
jgi:hypothetical protein